MITSKLFGGSSFAELNSTDFEVLKSELGVVTAKPGDDLVEILCAAELASSKSEARRFLESNAIYVNGTQLPLEKTILDTTDAIAGHAVLRRGKNAQKIVEFTS
ncbi:MAG: S4 domain-containing protein [Candidatus Saccharibacteria bacterium]|nr:S4 domain-containing protein [Candidatus Saccharibacteria bacterium]